MSGERPNCLNEDLGSTAFRIKLIQGVLPQFARECGVHYSYGAKLLRS